MTNEECKKVEQALADFVIRVANKGATCEAEIEVLPQIAQLLLKD